MKKILSFIGRHKLFVIPVFLAFLVFIAIVLLSGGPVEKSLYNYSFF